MSELNKLRNSLREHYDTRDFPCNESEWERAGILLRSKRRRRRMGTLALLLVIGSALITAVTGTFMGDTTESHLTVNSKPVVSKRESIQNKELNLEDAEIKSRTEKKSNLKGYSPSSIHSGSVEWIDEKRIHQEGPPEISDNKSGDQLSNFGLQEVVSSTDDSGNSKMTPDVAINETENNIIRAAEIGAEVVSIGKQDTDHQVVQAQTAGISGQPADSSSREQSVPDTTRTDLQTVNSAVAVTQQVNDTSSDSLKDQENIGEGIFYEAGAAWLFGWKGNEGRDANGLSPVAGINYMNHMTNRCAFSFGVQYLMVPNLSGSSKTSRVSSYKYGEVSAVTVITPMTLHYLNAPLRFHFDLHQNNIVGGGVNIAYLINVNASVETYDEKPGVKENHQKVVLSGYTEGFSWFDSQVSLFYRRQLTKTFGVQAELFVGLTDIKDDQFFGSSAHERNSGVKLTMVYYAFRKNGFR